MSTTNGKPSRRKREPGPRNTSIYRRYDDQFEVGYHDSFGKQRWSGPFPTVTAARDERDDIAGRKSRGERVAPNPKLKFGEAADRWLADQVSELRPGTQAIYTSHVENHLRERWGHRQLDSIDVDHAAKLVRELRASGLAERSIGGVVAVAGRIFKFAKRRMGWHGVNPMPGLETGERPKAATGKRRIYVGDELAQTLAAAPNQWRVLFQLACVTGARKSELLALTWADLDLTDPERASARIGVQVDRQGRRVALKTDDSLRDVQLPRSLAMLMLEHKAKAKHCRDQDFVFCTRTGTALSQRNALRALRQAQKQARTPEGEPTFPKLHEKRAKGDPVPRDAAPNFHGFRHTAASEAIAAGDSAETVSWQLGHKNSVITRQVYIQEVKNAERQALRRAQMEDRYGALLVESELEAAKRIKAQQKATAEEGELVDLQQVRDAQQ